MELQKHMKRKLFWLGFILINLISLFQFPVTPSATVEAQSSIKIGGLDVAAYCARRGRSAVLVNNNRDWACSDGSTQTILSESDITLGCREQYGNRVAIVAVKDGSDPIPAYNWSCYDTTVNNPRPQPANFGPTRIGNIDLAGYCDRQGYGIVRTADNQGWVCTNRADGSTAINLNQTNYNLACRQQYGDRLAIVAKQDGTSALPSDNWSCHDISKTSVPSTLTSGGRLGTLYVDGLCITQGHRLILVNDNKEFACLNPFTNQVVKVLGAADYNTLCRETYHSTAFAVQEPNATPAFGWACYEPVVSESFGEGSGTTFNQNRNPLGRAQGALAAKPGYEVNVRAEPSLEAAKLGRINAQGTYVILGRSDDGLWYRIEYNGQVGYVAARWVQVKNYTFTPNQ